jgi:MFS family permease
LKNLHTYFIKNILDKKEPTMTAAGTTRLEGSAEPTFGWRDVFGPSYLVTTSTLFLGVSLHAVNLFLFNTLAPSIVADIGGLDLLSWATTVYVVASIIGSAAGGLARGAFGARRALLGAAAVYAAGTAICGLAPTMEIVLVGRLAQGLGAGLTMANSHGMIRDLYPKHSWARMFSATSAVWGVASLLGPGLGGIFAEFLSWRPGMLVMVPLAGVFAAMVLRIVPAGGGGQRGNLGPVVRLGLIGAAAFALGLASKPIVDGLETLVLAAAAILMGVAILWERRTATKLFPNDTFRPFTPIGAVVIFVFGMCFALVPNGVYGPLLFQTLHGISPLYAGYVVTLSSMGWTIAALVLGGVTGRVASGIILLGPFLMLAGLAGAGTFLPQGPIAAAGAAIFTIGFGIGMTWGHVASRLFAAAGEADRDRVTSVMPTIQNLGVAFGAATVGIVADGLGVAMPLTDKTAELLGHWAYWAVMPLPALGLIGALRLVTVGPKD